MTFTPSGPLVGLRVLEFSSIGPGPHCAMLLADLGADVIRIDRPGGNGWPNPIVDRGRAAIVADIRTEAGHSLCLEAAGLADVVIEGFRPGTMERLGLGPDILVARNAGLIYGRITGWGQEGPLAHAAGHDINYIALAGALAPIGRTGEAAVPPLNLVGDFGGGSMFLAFGIMAALWERERSGKGQVIDAAIVDGVSSLMTMFAGLVQSARISLDREKNILSGAAHFYRSYLCLDGREIALGAIEPQFYSEMLEIIGAPRDLFNGQNDISQWKERSKILEDIFAKRTREEWCALLEGTDACFAPVLELDEVMDHPHLRARSTFVPHDGGTQAAPAPRFSRTPGACQPSRDGLTVLREWQASR